MFATPSARAQPCAHEGMLLPLGGDGCNNGTAAAAPPLKHCTLQAHGCRLAMASGATEQQVCRGRESRKNRAGETKMQSSKAAWLVLTAHRRPPACGQSAAACQTTSRCSSGHAWPWAPPVLLLRCQLSPQRPRWAPPLQRLPPGLHSVPLPRLPPRLAAAAGQQTAAFLPPTARPTQPAACDALAGLHSWRDGEAGLSMTYLPLAAAQQHTA